MCFKQGVTNINGSNHQKELKLFIQRCEAKDLCFSAGFVYTPEEAGDDTATCLYCNVSLSGWDDDDDPVYVIGIPSR